MTVETAAARRTVIDLGADATILDAARSLASVESPDIVLVVPSGAPLTRNAVFLEALRRRAGDRRIVLVSPEARARSLASSVHMKSFASISALDRHELDATEHLSDARRAVMKTMVRPAVPRRGISPLRGLAVFMTLVMAAGILLAIVAPSATITVAASASTLGPYEYDLRAGPQGEIKDAVTLSDTVTAQVKGIATGSRFMETNATGVEDFKNLTTSDILIPVGTLVWTNDSPPIRFQTTEEKVLPKSTILPVPKVGTVSINIKAVDAGPKGNVPADRIKSTANSEVFVTNPTPTTAGDTKKIAIVQRFDYDTAASQADKPLLEAGLARTARWNGDPAAPKDTRVYGVWVKQTAISPPSDVVFTEPADGTFVITATGTATAYRVSSGEPRAAALGSLRNELTGRPGMTFDNDSATVDIVLGPNVGENGVQWRVVAKAQQYASVDAAQMKAALTGHTPDDVGPVAAARGFKKLSVETWPSWWPLLPVLDSRITIKVEAPVTAGAP
ncbi:MAG: hypothetical protein E6H89_03255 [Chloroflexi bacterium]|nr:MAG: hypothetical protein E6H89_03255 [Chloroflexota bacterium]